MPGRPGRVPTAVLLGLWAAQAGCTVTLQVPELHEPTVPVAQTKDRGQLKVHMRSGELLVLDEWKVSPDGDRLRGTGQAYTVTREPKGGQERQDVAVADVAVLETTSSKSMFSPGMGVMATTTVILGSLTVACVASPKSCFGSCPTFYVGGAGSGPGEPERPQAEGFSASIASVLEARDLDALGLARPGGSRVDITMRNEALETHAVRRVRLLAAPRPAGGRVLAGIDDRLYPTPALVPPLACRAPEGDCLEALGADDGRDRASSADPSDLATREEIELLFPAAHGRSGVAIAARQTLLSTFLFYQSMAYFGRGAGEYLAALERGGPAAGRRAMGMARLLGGVEVEVAEGESPWRAIGSFDEPGPIAGDVRVVPFEATGGGALHVRLRLAKGHWRLGSVGLARLGEPVAPVAIEAESVEHGGGLDEDARRRLQGGDGHLVTHPGDAYRLVFLLPPSAAPLELFLESEGYYYEWMRQEWLADEDPEMAALVLADPAEALRRLAPVYKAHESRLEREFWASRFRE